MAKNIKVDVHHLTRVEGHGNIVVNVTNGKIEKCEWQVPEAPRFFESMVRGRHYSEVARITSRICGICSVGHTLASVKGTESALGIEVSSQTKDLRNLLKMAEMFDSHIVHILFLVAPDLLGAKSVFPLIPTHGEVIKTALRLKRFGHELGALLAGRTTHPTMVVPGGFASYPSKEELLNIKTKLENEILADLTEVLKVLLSVKEKIPAFDRPTEYMALSNEEEYAFYDGQIQTVLPEGDKAVWPISDYKACTNEYIVSQSTAKYTKNRMDSLMVGALARVNNNFEQLNDEAKGVAEQLGLTGKMVFNPYLNNVAQVIEIVHSIHSIYDKLKYYLTNGIEEEPLVQPTKSGWGAGAVEVPRGILFHSYEYDEDGICQGGDFIIPTNQNHANIQLDMEKLVPELLQKDVSEEEMELALEMLVRSYDPCISCSTHYVKVKFVT